MIYTNPRMLGSRPRSVFATRLGFTLSRRVRLQEPSDPVESPDQPDDDDPEESEDEKRRRRQKEKDDENPKDPEDDEGEHNDSESARLTAYDRRQSLKPGPKRFIKATPAMFRKAREKVGTYAAPKAPKLDDPNPTRRAAAAILAAGEKAKLVRSDPPLPDKVNAAARFMIERSRQRAEAQKAYRKLGFVRP
jgi:hypothetical protein